MTEEKKPAAAAPTKASNEPEDNALTRDRASAADKIAASAEAREAELEALREPADINAAPATAIESSGAITEPSVKKAVDVDHPAVDNNPRAGTTVNQNRIDFNDPTLNDREAVEENLSKQG